MTDLLLQLRKQFANSLLGGYLMPVVIAAASMAIMVMDLEVELRFQREKLLAYEGWRLVTGHLAHLGWRHFILNIITLFIIWNLFFLKKPNWRASIECLVLALLISIELLLFSPAVQWYVGLSGVLHGLFALGSLELCKKKRPLGFVAAALLVVKITVEQTFGLSNSLLNDEGPVLVDAHLYGAIAAVFIAIGQTIFFRLRRSLQNI